MEKEYHKQSSGSAQRVENIFSLVWISQHLLWVVSSCHILMCVLLFLSSFFCISIAEETLTTQMKYSHTSPKGCKTFSISLVKGKQGLLILSFLLFGVYKIVPGEAVFTGVSISDLKDQIICSLYCWWSVLSEDTKLSCLFRQKVDILTIITAKLACLRISVNVAFVAQGLTLCVHHQMLKVIQFSNKFDFLYS